MLNVSYLNMVTCKKLCSRVGTHKNTTTIGKITYERQRDTTKQGLRHRIVKVQKLADGGRGKDINTVTLQINAMITIYHHPC